MNLHVYARVSGFGWSLLPFAPFLFERVPHRRNSVSVVHLDVDGPKRVALEFSEDAPILDLGKGVNRLSDVLELLEGPGWDHWRIETSVYSVRWPEGFAVQSTPDPPGFELIGPGDTLIYLQGPLERRNLPNLDRMIGPGQTIHQLGSDWVELDYLHESAPWRQTHRLLDFGPNDAVVVTSQAPQKWGRLIDVAAVQVAESLVVANE